MPDEVKYNLCKLFADDCKLYGAVNDDWDNTMQIDLNSLESWSHKRQLPFNAAKCKVMHFGYSNPKRAYEMNNVILETSDHEKDLGVIIDDSLKFHVHTAAAIKNANQTLGMMKKAYTSRDHITISTLYKAMVRPHLEYGNTIWGPFSKGDMKSVESVQRRATKIINGLRNKSYEERLTLLKLPSLRYRRRRGNMIWMHKIMNRLIRIDVGKLFIPAKVPHMRGHSQKIFKKHAVKAARRNSFSQRTVNDWNSLPNLVVESPTLVTFKVRLGKYWQNIHYDHVG